jgi:hypothetical protein
LTEAGAEEADAALAERLAGHRLLLCYGLLGEVLAGLRPIGMDYMAGQLAWLRRIGVAAAPVPLPTAAPVAENAARIAGAILAEPSPVILVAHSKGGLEALSALLLPGVAECCRGFLALQSPFHGSPVADAALGFGPLKGLAHHALRASRLGDGQGLADLTCALRGPWMVAHEAEIAALAASVPVASLAAALDAAADWRERAYLPLVRWMEARGAGPSDGLVPVASTLLPGARHAVFRGGHRALIAAAPGRDPVALLRAELGLLLHAELGLLRAELARPLEEQPGAEMATPSPPPPSPAPHPPSR